MPSNEHEKASGKKYVLVTAAYNEEAFIERLIKSVVSQTIQPQKWIIVSDASTDRTDEIVSKYSRSNPFITLLRMTNGHQRNFTAQYHAINAGFSELQPLKYDYIGNLDADVSFDAEYFSRLITLLEEDSNLGLAGGSIYEQHRGKEFRFRPTNRSHSVPLAVQLFRRDCLESIGGAYLPLPYGGPDWHAEVTARMRGWRVQSFPDLKVFHHRPTGSADGVLRYCFQAGLMDFSVGAHPLFQIIKLLTRTGSRPFILGSLYRLVGFMWAYCRREKRAVSPEFAAYLRREQMERVQAIFR